MAENDPTTPVPWSRCGATLLHTPEPASPPEPGSGPADPWQATTLYVCVRELGHDDDASVPDSALHYGLKYPTHGRVAATWRTNERHDWGTCHPLCDACSDRLQEVVREVAAEHGGPAEPIKHRARRRDEQVQP